MSGIEIAGLVLGAIPLIVAALEHYEDIISPGKALYRFHGELGRAIQELGNQHALFEQSIEVLLRPITTDQELSEMMDNTNSDLWQDPEIEQHLRNHLGKAYSPYTRTMVEIQRVMIGIASKLDNLEGVKHLTRAGLEAIISQHAAAKVDGKHQKFEISKRIKFTMKRKKIRESLEELRLCIETLDKFQVKADKIAENDLLYRSDGQAKAILSVEMIRKNAKELYRALSKTWCAAHPSHLAGLMLEHRLMKKPKRGRPGWQKKKTDEVDANCFGLSVLQVGDTVPKKWLDVEIRLVDAAVSSQPSRPAVQARPASPPCSSAATSVPYRNPAQLQIITDLCSTLQNPCHPCIGLCVDSDGHLRGTYKAQRSVAYVEESVSLEDILKKKLCTFTQKERYNLSIALTSSLLQLSHTPWLQESWNKNSIVFLRAKGSSSSSVTAVDVMHPYLTREHKEINTPVRQRSGEPNDSLKIVALGIMLLEITYGVPIEDLLRPEDLGPNHMPNEASYLQAARRWLMGKEGKGQFSFAFQEAISYCLKCFVEPGAILSDEAFAKTIEDRVLRPLEDEMDILLNGPVVK